MAAAHISACTEDKVVGVVRGAGHAHRQPIVHDAHKSHESLHPGFEAFIGRTEDKVVGIVRGIRHAHREAVIHDVHKCTAFRFRLCTSATRDV